MATLYDLFESSNKNVNYDTETQRLEQQLNGLRTDEYASSLVSLYGSEIIRIESQRTNLVTEMRDAAGSGTDGGLVGEALSGVSGGRVSNLNEGQQFVANKLGIPRNLTPTRILATGELQDNPTTRTMITLGEIKGDGAGTLAGKFLSKTGGGTPSQIGQQAIGQGIGAIKREIRSSLFGDSEGLQGIEITDPTRVIPYTDDETKYSDFRFKGQRDDDRPELLKRLAEENDTTPFGETLILNPYKTVRKRKPDRPGERTSDYYNSSEFDIGGQYRDQTANSRRTVFQRANSIDDENIRGIDSVIVRIGDIRFNLVAITGITDNFSPSWNASNMIGNPFPQYTYDSITRDTSFDMKMYSTNPEGHRRMWSQLENLAKLVYPLKFTENTGFVTPPITTLTIGSMFRNKRGFISSLSYNVDDTGQWELGFGDEVPSNSNGEPLNVQEQTNRSLAGLASSTTENYADGNWKLPKIIDVSLGFTFIESRADVEDNSLYSFTPIS